MSGVTILVIALTILILFFMAISGRFRTGLNVNLNQVGEKKFKHKKIKTNKNSEDNHETIF